MVWVKPKSENTLLPEKIKGAYVNIGCICGNETELRDRINAVFAHHNFNVIEIEDIEEFDLRKEISDYTIERRELLNDLREEGLEFVWSSFHTW